MSGYQDGLRVLKKIAEEQRNWQSGLLQIETLLAAGERAEAVLRDKTQREADLDARVARLTAEEATLRAAVEGFATRKDAQAQALKAAAAPLREELAALERQVAGQRQALADVKAEVAAVLARHSA